VLLTVHPVATTVIRPRSNKLIEAMVNEAQRKLALADIRENIARSGLHIYLVSGGATPRFAYTIGLSESIGAELILAGAIFYMKDDVRKIVNGIAAQLKADRGREVFEITELGSFVLRRASSSWAAEFMLGAFDYYQKREIPALQIVPDTAHWTIDVPDMAAPWSATREPIWRWQREAWTYPVSKEATATTNLAALHGERVTEAVRWEEDNWELFAGAGPDVSKDELRIVPLGTLLAADPSLVAVINLEVGAGLWRDDISEWHPWARNRAK
jgi:hypothetical protein